MPVPTLITDLSQTPASNSPPGSESPSTVDDYLRTYSSFIAQVHAEKASVASIQAQTATAFTTAGTSTAYTLTPSPAITAYAAGQSFFVNFNAASGATPTLAISGIATPPNLVRQIAAGTYQNIAAGDIPANHRSRVTLLSASQALVEILPPAATGLRNPIINGAMQIWQRGVTFNDQTVFGAVQYSADRWLGNRSGDATGQNINRYTVTSADRTAAGNAALPQYGLQWQRAPGNAALAAMNQYYSLETVDSIPLAGQRITFSFFARNGANYSGGALIVAVSYGTGTDQRYYAMTGSVQAIYTTPALTTGMTRYTFTSAAILPITATQVGVGLQWTPTGTAGADDSVYITGVQLEAAAVATPFEHRLFGMELALCQRYARPVSGNTSMGLAVGAGAAFFVSSGVPLRVTPTLSVAAGFSSVNAAGGITAMTTLLVNSLTPDGSVVLVTTTGAGLVAGNATFLNGPANAMLNSEL